MASNTKIENPTMWEQPLGYNAEVSDLPSTVPTATSAEASFEYLFPHLTEKKEEDGGFPPQRTQFNALFKMLGENIFFLQQGGTYQYEASISYKRNALIMYNGVLYVSEQAANQGHTPGTAAAQGYWRELVRVNSINGIEPDANGNIELDLSALANLNNDNDFTGDTSFSGKVTFTGLPSLKSSTAVDVSSIQDEEIPTMGVVREYIGSIGGGGGSAGGSFVRAVKVTSPVNGSKRNSVLMEFAGEPYHNAFEEDERAYREFQFTLQDDTNWKNATVNKVNSDGLNLTYINKLQPHQAYKLRVRDVSQWNTLGDWSTNVLFTTGEDVGVATPSVNSIDGHPMNVTEAPRVQASAFSTTDGSDTHFASQWVIRRIDNHEIVFDSKEDRNNLTTILIPRGTLEENTAYELTLRYKGTAFGWSAYGNTNFTTAARFTYVATPSVSVENDGINVPEDPVFNTSLFNLVTTTGAKDTHMATSWLVTDLDGQTIWHKDNDKDNLRTIKMPRAYLQEGIRYIVKVKYFGRTYESDWGETEFITAARFTHVATPTLNVTGAPDNVPDRPTLTATAFTLSPPGRDSDEHQSTDWAVYRQDDEQVAVWEQTYSDDAHKTSVTIPSGKLETNQTYIFKVRFHGKKFGESEWASVTGTTKEDFTYIDTPTLSTTGDTQDVRESPTFTAKPFHVTSDTGESDTHESTDWAIYLSAALEGKPVYQSDKDQENLTSWTVPAWVLQPSTSYRVQCRYNGKIIGSSAWASLDITTHSTLAYVKKPATLSVAGAPLSVPDNATLQTSSFVVFSDNNTTDSHESSDYEVLNSSSKALVWHEYNSKNLTSITMPPGKLSNSTEYVFRARHRGARLGVSEWAETTGQTMERFDYVRPPELSIIAGSISGNHTVLETPTFTGGAFAFVSSSGATDTHQATEWQVLDASSLDTVSADSTSSSAAVLPWSKTVTASDGVDLTRITLPSGLLQTSHAYKVRCRYQGKTMGWSSAAELDFSTNEDFTFIAVPNLVIPGAPNSVQEKPILSGGLFTVIPNSESDTHESTDWAITKAADNSEVWSSLNDTTNLTSIAVPKGKLQESTAYSVKVRYKGAKYGYSQYAEATITTATSFSPIAPPNLTVEQDILGVYEAPFLSANAMVNTSELVGDIHTATDWKVMNAADRSVVWSSSSDTMNRTAIQMPVGKLKTNTAYIFAVRYQALTSGWGPWTEVQGHTQAKFYAANLPTLLNANIDRAGVNLRFEFSTPQLQTRPLQTAPTHLRVKVYNKTQDNYVDQFTTTIVDTGNYILERKSEYDLSSSEQVYYQVFYKSNSEDDDSGVASATAEREITVNENILVILENIGETQNNVTCNPYIEISLNYGPTSPKHVSTDWEITDISGNETIWSSLKDTTHLTSITADAHLAPQSFYRLKIKAYCQGAESKLLDTVIRTGLDTGIGSPGSLGFGVGICPDEDLVTSLGLTPLVGYSDPKNDNYGNYQHSNGSVMCWIPAFCYSFSNIPDKIKAKSPSAFQVRSAADFSYSETKANAAGYILHRAFIDGGQVKKGFFFDKYLMSFGNKAVKGGIPISLNTGTNAPSKESTYNPDCLGQARDAITISKKRGASYNCASGFMYSALAMLSFAQGLNAQSTDVCAWYDATGTTNFPKGCNNNALGDYNDKDILYQNSDTSTKQKPNTGSANHFARTTHNGQNCGVCDINGCLYQVATGLIRMNDNRHYLMKESAKFTDFTIDNVQTTNSTLYEVLNVSLPANGSYWGDASKNSFYTNQNNQQRALCGLVPASSTSNGTNEFGNDYFYAYNGTSNYNGALLCCGYWAHNTSAGVWYRSVYSNVSVSWTSGYAYWGFRAAAY